MHEIYDYLKPKKEGTPDTSRLEDPAASSSLQPTISGADDFEKVNLKQPVFDWVRMLKLVEGI